MYDAYTNDNGINDEIKWKGNFKKRNTSEYTNWSENQSKSRINWKEHREFKMRVK